MKRRGLPLTLTFTIAAAMGWGIVIGSMPSDNSAQAEIRAFAKTQMFRWEYCQVEAASPKEIVDKANDLGAKGWELATTTAGDGRGAPFVAYFKRPSAVVAKTLRLYPEK